MKLYDGKPINGGTAPTSSDPQQGPKKGIVSQPDPGSVKTEHPYQTQRGSLYTGKKAQKNR